VDRPEGPLTDPERPMLQAFLDWHRATLLHKCAGLTGEQLAERAVPPSGLSLLGLIRHMTKVERAWFRQRFAGEPVDDPFGGDKTADFERGDPARAAADYARLTEEFKLADAAVANASLDDTFVHRGETMSLRLIYLHMIEEYARHNGHADLLRERIDGATGELPGPGGEVRAGRGARQGGEDAVVDAAEGEGLHEQVVPRGIDGQHRAAPVERVLFAGDVREPGDLRPQHADQLPVGGGQLDDLGHGGAVVAGGGDVAAGRRDDVAAIGRDQRGPEVPGSGASRTSSRWCSRNSSVTARAAGSAARAARSGGVPGLRMTSSVSTLKGRAGGPWRCKSVRGNSAQLVKPSSLFAATTYWLV
jgi:uncharacterized damage-inducible protein DinB